MSSGPGDLSMLSDLGLLQMVRDGDEGAFVALYRRHQGKVYKFCIQMSGSKSIAEDVTQEVFIAVMRDPARYDPGRGSIDAFLYGIARNHVLRRLGADRRFLQMDTEDAGFELADPPDKNDPHSDATRSETVKSVRKAILSLPEHYREAVVLCDLHEMTYEDASAVLGCAVGTVRSRLHRGRKMLMDKLKPVAERQSQTGEASSARCVV